MPSTLAHVPDSKTPPQDPGMLPALVGSRESTRRSWRLAVQQAIELMRERMSDPLTLEELAHAALLSPYHFNRVFRLVTGIPPGQFLTALRMAEAKRLVLSTSERVTDVCFAVGFESLGTFTTRFGQLVGVAPQELRRLAELHGRRPIASIAVGDGDAGEPAGRRVSGRLLMPRGVTCVTLVGLFDRAVPQGLPQACAILPGSASAFHIDGAVGRQHLLAVGFPAAGSVLDATLLDPARLLVGVLPRPIRFEPDGEGQVQRVRLHMRLPGPTSPPIVLAGPLIAAEVLAAGCPEWGSHDGAHSVGSVAATA